jgi:hypothetical protein
MRRAEGGDTDSKCSGDTNHKCGGDTDSKCAEWTKEVEAVSAEIWVTNQEGSDDTESWSSGNGVGTEGKRRVWKDVE